MSHLEERFKELWNAEGPAGYRLVSQYGFVATLWSDTDGWKTHRWKFDFAIPTHRIAIELEGMQGRHQFTSGFRKDMIKYNVAVSHGWRLLRFQSGDLGVKSGIRTIERIEKCILSVEHEQT